MLKLEVFDESSKTLFTNEVGKNITSILILLKENSYIKKNE